MTKQFFGGVLQSYSMKAHQSPFQYSSVQVFSILKEEPILYITACFQMNTDCSISANKARRNTSSLKAQLHMLTTGSSPVHLQYRAAAARLPGLPDSTPGAREEAFACPACVWRLATLPCSSHTLTAFQGCHV